MNKNSSDLARPRRQRGAAIFWVIGIVLLLAAGGIAFWQNRGEAPTKDLTLTWAAVQEKMRVSIVESGQLKAAKSVDIYCKVKGGATILELVDEGTRVNEGDVVVRLDASNLEDELTAQKIKFLNAKAALIQAEKAKEIQESKNASDTQKISVDLTIAQTDLEKYLNGDFPIKEQQAISDEKLAESEEKTAQKKAEDTAELVALDFAADSELQSDQLTYEKAKVKREMAGVQKKMLAKYDKPRQQLFLQSDVDQKTAELDRVKLRCVADIAQKIADFESKKATFDLEESKLKLLESQLNNTVIKASASGLVVYPGNGGGMGGMGRSDRDRVEEGAQARENQLLISLPDTSEMVVVVSVHESAVDKLVLGQPAIVTIDAIADRSFIGKVTFIAPLPDSQNQWLNPDLKVYRCEITLGDDTAGLRPGMSASAEIVVDELADTIGVPIHAVHRSGDHFYVFVDGGDGKAQIREIKTGMHNDSRVAVADGLAVGDQVFLSTPAGAPQPNFPASAAKAAETSVGELRKRADAISSKVPKPDEQKPTAAGGPFGGFDMAAMAKMKDMTPEERAKAWEEMLSKMTPEQRKQWEERAKSFGGGAGGAGGAGGGGRGPGGGGGDRGGGKKDGEAKPASGGQ